MVIQTKIQKFKDFTKHITKKSQFRKQDEETITAYPQQNTKQKKQKNWANKKFVLSEEQLADKISRIEAKIKEYQGPEHHNMRKSLYHMISKLRKAEKEPEKYLKDPQKLIDKQIQDQKRRANKKLDNKREEQRNERKEVKNESRHIKKCLNCQQKGHLIEDCPELIDNKVLCYNCGSKKHSLRQCPEVRNTNLPFAICFICKEQGHISRDCPQNDKGLYIHGGGCFICDSIEHTKKDCPKNPDNFIKKIKYDRWNNGGYREQEPEWE